MLFDWRRRNGSPHSPTSIQCDGSLRGGREPFHPGPSRIQRHAIRSLNSSVGAGGSRHLYAGLLRGRGAGAIPKTRIQALTRRQIRRASVTVTIGGHTVTPNYAGGAPGSVAGVMQVNVQIPSGVQTGSAVPVVARWGMHPARLV